MRRRYAELIEKRPGELNLSKYFFLIRGSSLLLDYDIYLQILNTLLCHIKKDTKNNISIYNYHFEVLECSDLNYPG